MWFDGVRQPNTLYVASVSRGKDSTAMLRAIQLLGFPLDAIVSVDVWFDDDTPAELPPMVAFKDEWDKKCYELFGMPVTRVCATERERERERETAQGACHTQRISTADEQTEHAVDSVLASQCNNALGAKNSKRKKLTYTKIFYRRLKPRKQTARSNTIYGFPMQKGTWCNSKLKVAP